MRAMTPKARAYPECEAARFRLLENGKRDIGHRRSGQLGGMVLLGGRDDFREVRLDLLEIRESIRGPGSLGGWSVRGRSRFRSRFGRRGQQFRDVGDAGPGNHGSRRTYEVVVAEVAAGEGRADGLRTLPALELQAIGVKDIPVGHGYRPCCPGIKTKWLKA